LGVVPAQIGVVHPSAINAWRTNFSRAVQTTRA
jgi:hypothetical protein